MSERKNRNEKLDARQQQEDEELKEIVSLDVDEAGEETADLDAETTLELLQDAQEEEYAQELDRLTDDEAVRDNLMQRQNLSQGREKLQESLAEHHAKSPDLAGDDIDAAWDQANVGEETVGGTAPTPDQDSVEELAEPYGISYEDDEPLQTAEKLEKRDRERWELNPESAEDDSA